MKILSKLFKKPTPPNLPVVEDKKLIKAVSMREAFDESISIFFSLLIVLSVAYVMEYGFTAVPYFWVLVMEGVFTLIAVSLFHGIAIYFSATRFYRKNSVFLKYPNSRGAHEAERTDTNGKDNADRGGMGNHREAAIPLDKLLSS